MLGLGSNLISGVYVEAAAATPTIGIGITTVTGINDEQVGIVQPITSGLDVTGVSDFARVDGVEGNVTITHTHGANTIALDPVVAETVTLYAYKFPGSNSIFLTELTSGSYSSFLVLDLTSINSGSIAAVDNGNKYTVKVNFISKSGLNNSAAGDLKVLTLSAA
tara:strand:- start:2733 stop:3224 length:492 start_codon:yes stop_codon:yes gene_type:complete